MSGIYIPGLRVPEENEDELWIAVRSDGTVTFNAEWGWTMNKGKAVSVPPHGGLIDVDALEKMSLPRTEIIDGEIVQNRYVSLGTIRQMPTIIQAEEGDK